MEPHPYLCDCSKCDYERTLRRVREMQDRFYKQQEQDPFPPRGAQGAYQFIDEPWREEDRRAKKERLFREAYSNNVGFKEGNRKWRRFYDQALEVFNWQYQPWPGHEWVTYFTVTRETIERAPNINFAGHQAIMNANKALSEKRFYKIERVD